MLVQHPKCLLFHKMTSHFFYFASSDFFFSKNWGLFVKNPTYTCSFLSLMVVVSFFCKRVYSPAICMVVQTHIDLIVLYVYKNAEREKRAHRSPSRKKREPFSDRKNEAKPSFITIFFFGLWVRANLQLIGKAPQKRGSFSCPFFPLSVLHFVYTICHQQQVYIVSKLQENSTFFPQKKRRKVLDHFYLILI